MGIERRHMTLFHTLSDWSVTRSAWLTLLLSSLFLLGCALYFQYGLGLAPCIMCIYQRLAVVGVAAAGLLPLLINHQLTRFLGYALALESAGWGWLIAREHLEILTAANPFFASCEIVPNFPSWFALHQWFPSVFAATGDCLENRWQFLSMGMAEWMHIIFALYFLVILLMLLNRLVCERRF